MINLFTNSYSNTPEEFLNYMYFKHSFLATLNIVFKRLQTISFWHVTYVDHTYLSYRHGAQDIQENERTFGVIIPSQVSMGDSLQ